MSKKYLIFIIAIAAFVAVGIFLVGNKDRKTFYIKNNHNYTATASTKNLRPIKNIEFGNLQDTIIPSILKEPENLTENLAESLAQGIISENINPKVDSLLPGPGINMPNVSQIAQNYISTGLKTANDNILNIAPIQLMTSPDNNKDTIASYLSQVQIIINDNLDPKKIDLVAILTEINANNGAGLEKLFPVIIAHETAANQLERKLVPNDLKNLMTEEIRLLRITANIFKALVNVEADPLATITAIKQFEEITKNWDSLQKKFNIFIQKLNRT